MSNLITFGKYKGMPIEAIQQDQQYCDWLLTQSWFKEKYMNTYQVIINNFGEPSETPEHNKLQSLFVDDNVCLDLMNYLGAYWVYQPKLIIEKRIQQLKKSIESDDLYSLYKREANKETIDFLEAKIKNNEIKLEVSKRFEESGWDLVVHVNIADEWDKTMLIELKPCLGDDYPAVLRQMNSNKSRSKIYGGMVLIYGEFTAKGADEETVKSIFELSKISALRISEFCNKNWKLD